VATSSTSRARHEKYERKKERAAGGGVERAKLAVLVARHERKVGGDDATCQHLDSNPFRAPERAEP